jgi:hypothetical protein
MALAREADREKRKAEQFEPRDIERDMGAVACWLAEHGFESPVAAVLAGETGPDTKACTLAECARVQRCTVSEKIMALLYPETAGQLLADMERGWYAAIDGRPILLAPLQDYDTAVKRYRQEILQTGRVSNGLKELPAPEASPDEQAPPPEKA